MANLKTKNDEQLPQVYHDILRFIEEFNKKNRSVSGTLIEIPKKIYSFCYVSMSDARLASENTEIEIKVDYIIDCLTNMSNIMDGLKILARTKSITVGQFGELAERVVNIETQLEKWLNYLRSNKKSRELKGDSDSSSI